MSKFPRPARRRHRRFAAESLEQRCLLSAFVSEFPQPAATVAVASAVNANEQNHLAKRYPSDGVELLDLEIQRPDKKNSNSGNRIHVAELPDAVVSAVYSQLPQATIEKAETEVDDGARLFEVEVDVDGIEFHIKLSPDGEVLAIKQPLTATALPPPLRIWVERHFSGSALLEAERVADDDPVNYILLFATPSRMRLEAKLRITDGDSPPVPPMSDVTNGRDSEQPFVAEPVTTSNPSARPISWARVSPERPQTAHRDDRLANDAADQSSRDAAAINADADEEHSDQTDATRLAAVSDISEMVAKLMNVSLTNATSAAGSPLMARVVTEVLPQDLAAIERGLQEFLNGVNSLTDMTGKESAACRWLLPLLTAAAALYGAEKLISRRRKSARNPVLGAAGQSSWSWVLNLSASNDSKEQ